MTNKEAKKIIYNQWQAFLDDNIDYAGISEAYKMAIKALEQEPCEDCISRQAVIDFIIDNYGVGFNSLTNGIRDYLPSVTPKYTDEEIDKAQAVEQAYVDKMVELAVEKTKERYSDAIEKIKKAIDEMTEIHSDGEFYIKNVDAKRIISKYLCGTEMRGEENV